MVALLGLRVTLIGICHIYTFCTYTNTFIQTANKLCDDNQKKNMKKHL